MAINKEVLNTSCIKSQPDNVKKIMIKVQKLSKLGCVLEKEVSSFKNELSKWRF